MALSIAEDIYTALINDDERNNLIVADVVCAIEDKRFPLLLTERTDHLQLLLEELERLVPKVFVMKRGMGKKQRDALALEINSVPENQQRVIIATGRYIGEGFDDARLDTLFLAMPISWRGTLQQYVGRLHRLHKGQTSSSLINGSGRENSEALSDCNFNERKT